MDQGAGAEQADTAGINSTAAAAATKTAAAGECVAPNTRKIPTDSDDSLAGITPDQIQLPSFTPTSQANFMWNQLDGAEFVKSIHAAYNECVHWRRNAFLVPSGSVGKQFVKELTRLFDAYAQGSALESIALYAIMVACTILLQKPHAASKCQDHIKALDRRLKSWREGDVEELMREGRAIQHALSLRFRGRTPDCHDDDGYIAKTFAKLVFEGKIHSAIRYLSENQRGGVLSLDELVDSQKQNSPTVRQALYDKHPCARDIAREALVNTSAPPVHPVRYESLTGATIRAAALRTNGAAGPSGLDGVGWRRLCCSFHRDSKDLCDAVAAFARRICSTYVDPEGLTAFVACRLIPLNKNPGVRPIGVCEVVRRIVGKAILTVVKHDILQAAGPLQLCAGQNGGCEAAVHAMNKVFQEPSTDAVILVDASNAFNNINRRIALFNIQRICPAIATVLINCYRGNAPLFVDNEVIFSKEGTTQGDPLAMAFFGLASVPLIKAIAVETTIQTWFADDAASGGRLRCLIKWWCNLNHLGPMYGYFPNAEKTYLVVKPDKFDEARTVFRDTGINICQSGRRYLGGTVGSDSFATEFISNNVARWVSEIEHLTKIAQSQPHAAFAALTHGLLGKWLYMIRVMDQSANSLLQPLEMAICSKLIPALTGQPPPGDAMRRLLALPARLGGLGIIDPTKVANQQQKASTAICKPLIDKILHQEEDFGLIGEEQEKAKNTVRKERQKLTGEEAMDIKLALPTNQQRCVDLAREKGSSSWLTALPIQRQGFTLHKGAFRDALCLRYDWDIRLAPTKCRCGHHFDVNHVLTCRQGGFHTIRHNELRDTFSELLREVCTEVVIEPPLQPLSGECLPRSANKEDNARLDIRARGFWDGMQDAFFDVRVFHPLAPSYQSQTLSALYRQQEQRKRSEYGQRVREVEHGSFTPLVCTTSAGLAPEGRVFLKRLASLISEKRGELYSTTIAWLRCITCFCLLRSSLRCLRASPKEHGKIRLDCISEAMADIRVAL